ncbi:hypothetical protein AB0C74_36960 [Spirillospora sp. NPDC048832]
MSDRSSATHFVVIGTAAVVKQRQWTALRLIAEHAPGTAPAPVSADLAADPPTVVMSRLPGVPLSEPVGVEQAAAVARTVVQVQKAVPRAILADRLTRTAAPVFGTGDGNVADWLWDGSQARLVDFEYSGLSDRAYELAEMVEHISVRQRDGTALVRALEQVASAESDASRLLDCRRLHALFWLLRILGSGQGRSPRGSVDLAAQATRVLNLLG